MENVINFLRQSRRWDAMTVMTNDDYVINQHLYKLEQVAISYNAKWGVGRLEKLVTNALADKWNNQQVKLMQAIKSKDHKAVVDLVNGCLRGFEALEAEAIRLGHTPNPPEVWDVQHESGRVYRIVKNDIDGRAALDDGVCVYSLAEVARILEGQQIVDKVKDAFPEAKVAQVKAAAVEDSLPF